MYKKPNSNYAKNSQVYQKQEQNISICYNENTITFMYMHKYVYMKYILTQS